MPNLSSCISCCFSLLLISSRHTGLIIAGRSQPCSCLRAFALAMCSAWSVLLPHASIDLCIFTRVSTFLTILFVVIPPSSLFPFVVFFFFCRTYLLLTYYTFYDLFLLFIVFKHHKGRIFLSVLFPLRILRT